MSRPRTAALLLGLSLVLGLTACGRQAVQAPPTPPPSALAAPALPWTWHPLGGLAVVEGEVAEPTHLVLEGRSIHEARYAEPGPLRWEFFRPPLGERAVLRTAEGRELARFEFSLTPKKAAPPPARPRATRLAKQLPAPPRRTEAPPARIEAHLGATPMPPMARRKPATPPLSPIPEPAPKALSERAHPRLASTLEGFHPVLPSPFLPSSLPWPGMGEALNLTHGPGGHKRLLLSFDGGSTSEVAAAVLDVLKARDVRTTIFLTGAFIQRYPALVNRMAAEGHELGNHTMNHPHFAPGMKRDPKWTRERVQRELLEADAALVRLLGRPMDPFWRAPYGEHTAEIRRWAEELGYRHVGWSEGADTLDWATPKERSLYRSGDAILQRLQRRLNRDGDGLIVLMHLGSERVEGDRPSAGLGAFMDRARNEGWAFVTVSDYLRDLGKPAWDSQQRLALLQPPGSSAPAR